MFDTEHNVDNSVSDDLDTFADTLFGTEKTADPVVKEEVDAPTPDVEDNDQDGIELPMDDDDENQDDTPAPEEDDEPAKPAGKKTAKERIDELTKARREAERERNALQQKLESVLAKLDGEKPTAPVKTEAPKEVSGPSPDDLHDDGSLKYPLGEFDPAYVRDLTRYTIKQETEAARAEESVRREAEEVERATAALQTEWGTKLDEARTRYEDLDASNANLQETFASLDPSYGEFLANTIMSMENGTDVLYHLGHNIEEAQRIVAAGPTRAILALGALEARLAPQSNNSKKVKVTAAPIPPERVNRGTSVAVEVPDDTDDLDAFERKLFSKRGR